MSSPHLARSLHEDRLTKISESLVVKFGVSVRHRKAANQAHAHLHLDGAVLYVPKVFRYLEDASSGFNVGFIVMEHVRGVGLHGLHVGRDPSIAKRTMNAVRSFPQF
jgi:hypothetical protein